MPLLQRGVFARRGDERPPGHHGSRLHHHSGQNRDRRNDARHDMPVDIAVAQIACCVKREPQAVRADLFEQGDALCKDVVHAIRIDQVWQNFVPQNVSPSGVSSAAFGHGRIVQKRSVDPVNAGSARGGPSLAGTGCDAVSEIEAQLPGHRPEVSTDVLGSAETQARVRAYAHELRSRHVCHGGLHGQAGESPPLRCASIAHRRPLRPSLSAGDHGRPVTALRRIVGDSYRGWKVGGVSS